MLLQEAAEEEESLQENKSEISIWQKWCGICGKINIFLEKKFTAFALFIASHPYLTIAIMITLCFISFTGLLRFKEVSRVEELYLPQRSKSMQDLDRADKYFPTKIRFEEIYLMKTNGTIALDDELFKQALSIHQDVMEIPGLTGICLYYADKFQKNQYAKTTNSSDCVVVSPLEIFHFNQSKINNVESILNTVYNSPNILLRNGRPARSIYRYTFADFQFNQTSKEIKRANALRIAYLVKYAENNEMHSKQKNWEAKFIKYMRSKQKEISRKGYTILFYTAGKSLDESINESTKKDIQLIPFSFLMMVIFCVVTLSSFRKVTIGHFWLSFAGILFLFLAIGGAFSFTMLIGAPYISFAGVLPFLIFGVGLDDMFIIIDSLERQNPSISGHKRLAKAVGSVGPSITMTTMTDLIAFLVSMVTDLPAIRYFCLYAALSITFCYLMVITVFIALMSFDVKRIENGRNDCLPCRKANTNQGIWNTKVKGTAERVMFYYGTLLMKTPVRILLLIFSISLFILGIIGSTHIDQRFEPLDLGLKGSDYVLFQAYRKNHFPYDYTIQVIVDKPIHYENEEIQKRYTNLDNLADKNQFLIKHDFNWMSALRKWSSDQQRSCTGNYFRPTLKLFLQSNPMYAPDIVFNHNKTAIIASRMFLRSRDIVNTMHQKDMMLSLRHDLKETKLPAYASNVWFIFIEQYVITLPNTIRNLSICCCAILLITLPYLIHPLTTFLVFFGFLSLIFELLGLMFIWGVSLNGISMIMIVMAIGFSVDYSAHIAHAFMLSNAKTTEGRVVEALSTLGASVLMGGMSTFVGVLVIMFASSEIFKIFFKMVFGIVTLGLLHGMVFLPVHLSVFCRTTLRIPSSQGDDEDLEENEAISL